MPDLATATVARITLVFALFAPQAFAQSGPLYRVELLVFSQPSGATAEQWEAIPELEYPNRTRFLIYPGEQATPARIAPTSIAGGSAVGSGATPANSAQPQAFTTLSSGDRQLSGQAAAMQRSGRYRILFHEAWLQPMGGQADTVPIVLDRSGDGGPWPALQGTVKVYLSRYFYLETNLWLNTAGEYLRGIWRMPAPPLAPASGAATESALTTAPERTGTPPSQQQAPAQVAAAGTQQFATRGQELGPEYPFRHAVLLQQTRRMRGGELAYVDHPLLGVLIKITPLAATDGENSGSTEPR